MQLIIINVCSIRVGVLYLKTPPYQWSVTENTYNYKHILKTAESEMIIWSHLAYENTPIQINWKFYHQKNKNFQIK